MAVVEMQKETYVPEARQELATAYDFLRAHAGTGRGKKQRRYLLVGTGVGERVELPAEVYRILLQVVAAMSRGMAVTVSPTSQTLTTQQAADLLGVSRPTLIRLLDAGRIPFERIGTHRKLLLRDILNYRELRKEEQYKAIGVLAAEIDEDEDIGSTLESLRRARKEIAAERRAK